MKWKPVDVIVLVLGSLAGLSLLITVIVPVILGEPISDSRAEMLSSVAMSIIAVVSVYVGARIKERSDRSD